MGEVPACMREGRPETTFVAACWRPFWGVDRPPSPQCPFQAATGTAGPCARNAGMRHMASLVLEFWNFCGSPPSVNPGLLAFSAADKKKGIKHPMRSEGDRGWPRKRRGEGTACRRGTPWPCSRLPPAENVRRGALPREPRDGADPAGGRARLGPRLSSWREARSGAHVGPILETNVRRPVLRGTASQTPTPTSGGGPLRPAT